ncbi:hypothetical protein F8M41_017774 [Gigaspora margarita]|uniref:Uncharacterized protein n=1 Tax=Gigaspora margarita TaxID=4874 RepID=A0A8H4AMR4_GIGMA|nr:hypothetical protein F8M41_017774 [Gigaspora margarita]
MYVVKQQLTAKFNAHVERLTADLTTRDATFVVEGQRILTMLDQITETSSVALLISEQFAGPYVLCLIFPEDLLVLLLDILELLWVLLVAQVNYLISKESIKNFYYNNGDFRGSTLNKIGAWIDSKNNFNLANNME